MNRADGGWDRGYTILETMIFLAVSAAMFVSAMALINGKQQRTEFSTGVRDFESSLNDLANDVQNGYFSNNSANGQVYCYATSTSTIVSTTYDNRQGCILIGKAIQFAPNANTSKYSVVTMVGKQFVGATAANGDVQNINQSGVVAVSPTTGGVNVTVPNGTIDSTLSGGLTFGCLLFSPNAVTPQNPSPCTTAGMTRSDTFAFMTTFHEVDTVTNKQTTGASQVDLYVPATALTPSQYSGRPKATVAQILDGFTSATTYSSSESTLFTGPGHTLKSGVYICLQSGGTKQYALLSIGGQSGSIEATVSIQDGSC